VVEASPKVHLSAVLSQEEEKVPIEAGRSYRLAGVRLNGNGAFIREVRDGSQIKADKLVQLQADQFIYSRLFAWRGAFGVVDTKMAGALVSGEFPVFRVESARVLPEYLRWFFRQPTVWEEVERQCTGTTKASRNRFKEARLLEWQIPIPSTVEDQQELLRILEGFKRLVDEVQSTASQALADSESLMPSILAKAFGGGF
jgi:type I restriction enzyme S subunit